MPLIKEEKTFQDIQKEYDHLFKTEPVRDEDRAYRWLSQKLFEINPQTRSLLDVACGGGYFLRELDKSSSGKLSPLIGIDISREALELARKEINRAAYSICVAEHLPFKDLSFDAITCLGSMEHFLNIPAAIREMRRVAQNNALFFILLPNMFWYKDLWSVFLRGDKKHRNQTQERFAPLGEWKQVLEGAGLKVMKTIKYNGIAKSPTKQLLKDILIPLHFSYHFLFICRNTND